MADTTYKVKKGDTLGDIARNFGVSVGDISGYKSGNADLIYPDEVVTIGKKSSQNNDSSAYTSAVKDGLSELDEPQSTNSAKDPYGLEKVRGDYDTYKTNRQSAYENLKGLTTETFDSEYEKRGLAEKKAKMSELDAKIAEERQKRDDAINAIRTNPGLSASQMTGDIKKLADYQNSVINNYIQERNGVAGEYNDELTSIDKVVSNTVKDAQLDYQYWSDLLGESTGIIDDYTKAYRTELKDEQDQDNFEKQLAQALTIAQMKDDGGSGVDSKTQLVRDPRTGEALYWFNPVTQEITYVNPEDAPSESGGGDKFDQDFDSEEEDDGGVPWWKFWAK